MGRYLATAIHSGGDGPYGESPPERGVLFRPQVYIKGYGFHSLKYIKGLGNLSSGSA